MCLSGTRQQGSGEDYITWSFMICIAHPVLSNQDIKSRIMKWAGHVALWEREEVHTGFGGEI